jgi:hypothetical protein
MSDGQMPAVEHLLVEIVIGGQTYIVKEDMALVARETAELHALRIENEKAETYLQHPYYDAGRIAFSEFVTAHNYVKEVRSGNR